MQGRYQPSAARRQHRPHRPQPVQRRHRHGGVPAPPPPVPARPRPCRWRRSPTTCRCGGSLPTPRGRHRSAPSPTGPGWLVAGDAGLRCSTTTTRPAGDRGVGGGVVPARRHRRSGGEHRRGPRRPRPAHRGAVERHLRAHRRTARQEDLLHGSREGPRRPPVPHPHDADAQPRAQARRRAGETPEEFAARCSAAADEGADRDQVALQAKYEGRIAKARGGPRGGDGQSGAGRGRRDHPPPVRRGRGRRQPARRRARRATERPHDGQDMGRVLTGQGRRDEAAQRVRSAENRAATARRR